MLTMKLRDKLAAFKNDNLLHSTVVLSIVFLALHIIGYFDSDGKTEVIVRASALFFYPLFVLFGNRQGLRFWLVIYAYILFWFHGTLNYTPFIILALLSHYFSIQRTVIVFLIYAVLVSIRSTLNDIAPFRIIFHALKCAVFYFGIKLLIDGKKNEKIALELTPDEILILEELAKGKQLNELSVFSQNTICRKLKSARERNGLKNNEDLLLKYVNNRRD